MRERLYRYIHELSKSKAEVTGRTVVLVVFSSIFYLNVDIVLLLFVFVSVATANKRLRIILLFLVGV